MTLDALMQATDDDVSTPFGEYEEQAIVALLLDHPDLFSNISGFLTYQLFKRVEVQYIVASIMQYYEEYGVYPTRNMLLDIVKKKLTVDDPGFEDIISIVETKSDPREVPALKDTLIEWARSRSYGMLFDPETIQKYNNGDYEELEEIINQARNIQDFGQQGFWFFDSVDRLFMQEELEHFTTGFPELDTYLNEGGPSRKEVVVWMAPTGVGKSIIMCNNAVASVMDGRNVLYITLELSDLKSAIRMLGAFTNQPINNNRFDMQAQMTSMISKIRNSGAGDLVVYQYPPDEINVDHIHALMDNLKKTKGWQPDVVVIDYLELMRSRNESDNRDEYTRQKAASTQIRGLAIKENVLIFTATQTNRSGNESQLIDVTKMAESYGKSMPMDYLVSLNQSSEEYDCQFNDNGIIVGPSQARMYIAKNRNGVKFRTIPITINAITMKAQEAH